MLYPLFSIQNILAVRTLLPQKDVTTHINQVIFKIGDDHVALGSDFDSFINLPEGLTSISKMRDLIISITDLTDKRKAKIENGNILRVIKMVEKLTVSKVFN